MNGFWYQVEYEGLRRICTVCGCYGHLGRDCKNRPEKIVPPASSPTGMAAPGKNHEETLRAENPEHNSAINENISIEKNQEESLLGDWMMVPPRK